MFEKDVNIKKILDQDEELDIFKSYGVKFLIKCSIDDKLINMSPEQFIKEILVEKLGISKLICGKDFKFGKGRAGNCDTLKKLSEKYNFSLNVTDDYCYKDVKICSSLICEEIEKGNMEDVMSMLGRPYSISGEVVEGKKLGRKLSFPTINIVPAERKILPPFGVYYTKVEIDGITYDGVTNVGDNPTVNDRKNVTVETNLPGQDKDFYGRKAKVMFYRFVRKQMKFDSVEALKEQIAKDVECIRNSR